MVTGTLLLMSLAAISATNVKGSRPNILVLFADDLGYGDLSVYGHPSIHTPHLDKLASEGIRFTNWYSGFHVCSPSRASMLTGRLPIRSGIAGAKWTGGVFSDTAVGGLPLNETTLAEALKKEGYNTGMAGKYHLGQRPEFLPTSRGFDTYLGIPYSVDMGQSAWIPDTNRPTVLPLLANKTVLEQPVNLDNLSQRYATFVSDFITEKSQASAPWFFYMAFSHVHVPDFANPEFCNKSLRGRFGDALEEMDNLTGHIMAALEAAGVDDNTIVFFSSDNGPWLIKELAGGSAGLLRDGKTTTWEGGVRVPGIVRWTNRITPGWSPEVVATYDIFPTAVALAGGSLPTDRVIDGRDMSPVLFDGAASQHDCIYIYKGTPGTNCPEGHEGCPGLWAVRCGHYKAHWVTSNWKQGSSNGVFQNPPLLYNLDADPSENYPINNSSGEYKQQMDIINEAKEAHLKTVKHVPNQIALGTNIDYAVCGCPNSQSQYPQYPNCTCNPENFKVFVCGPLGPTVNQYSQVLNEAELSFPDA